LPPWPERLPVHIAQRFARQDQHERNALKHHDRGIRQPQAALQQAARRAKAAEQNGHRDHRNRVVPRNERDQDARIAVACDQ
jgi:hypothetical protein